MAASTKRWSARVTRESNALDLENDVFKKKSARGIARSLRRSAEESHRRKSKPFRSAMSMLTFYMNRAGKNLPASRRRTLNEAKDELRALYGIPRQGAAARRKATQGKSGRSKTKTHAAKRRARRHGNQR